MVHKITSVPILFFSLYLFYVSNPRLYLIPNTFLANEIKIRLGLSMLCCELGYPILQPHWCPDAAGRAAHARPTPPPSQFNPDLHICLVQLTPTCTTVCEGHPDIFLQPSFPCWMAPRNSFLQFPNDPKDKENGVSKACPVCDHLPPLYSGLGVFNSSPPKIFLPGQWQFAQVPPRTWVLPQQRGPPSPPLFCTSKEKLRPLCF